MLLFPTFQWFHIFKFRAYPPDEQWKKCETYQQSWQDITFKMFNSNTSTKKKNKAFSSGILVVYDEKWQDGLVHWVHPLGDSGQLSSLSWGIHFGGLALLLRTVYSGLIPGPFNYLWIIKTYQVVQPFVWLFGGSSLCACWIWINCPYL